MRGKFYLAWLVIFVLWMVGSVVVHGMLLHDRYAQLPNLFRTEEDAHRLMGWMFLAHVLLAGAFVWIYSRGIEVRPWLAQGVRFGVAIALLTVVPTYTIYYVVQPIPGSMAVSQMTLDGILIVLLGIVTAFLYRQTPTKA